ncbi:MAG TPA: hypothetical protein IAB85_03495 [Candidatus Coprenecus merdigallinarum]|nr:hypothetical protein [Candidatus Coprenecus merdigallinarum]
MDRYRQFIEDMRRSRPQMPHPEEVSARIAERTGNMPQNTPARPTPLRSSRIRFAAAVTGIAAAAVLVLTLSTVLIQTDTAVRTEISSLPVSTSAFMRGPQAHLEHYRKTKAHRQSVAGLKDRAANLQIHENLH